ncbi:MAG: AAA domain-containing protein [Methylacidiphilales bacterium]|nr:AAA domain-containing protein [Candidatus Methylacidiphilales bacterium]
MKINKVLVDTLLKKLKQATKTSIHLSALPGRMSKRIDLLDLELCKKGLSKELLTKLLHEVAFSVELSVSTLERSTSNEDEKAEAAALIRRLENIYNENEDNFLEFGFKNFGFGFPLLVKRSRIDPDKIIHAPLLIWSLELKKVTSKPNTWKIERNADMVVKFNEFLLSYLETDEACKYQVPESILDDEIINQDEIEKITQELLTKLHSDYIINKTLRRAEKTSVENLQNTEIHWSGVFGLYVSPKETIIQSMEELSASVESLQPSQTDPPSRELSTATAVPVDPSQFEIVSTLAKDEVKIIYGPPGTGKSQSLTAIISNALAKGQTCLVVCEKKTALDVIYENLKKVGLDQMTITIDDIYKDRKEFVDKARDICELLEDSRDRDLVKPNPSNLIALHDTVVKIIEQLIPRYEFGSKRLHNDKTLKSLIGEYFKNREVIPQNYRLNYPLYLDSEQYLQWYDNLEKAIKLLRKIHETEIATLAAKVFVEREYDTPLDHASEKAIETGLRDFLMVMKKTEQAVKTILVNIPESELAKRRYHPYPKIYEYLIDGVYSMAKNIKSVKESKEKVELVQALRSTLHQCTESLKALPIKKTMHNSILVGLTSMSYLELLKQINANCMLVEMILKQKEVYFDLCSWNYLRTSMPADTPQFIDRLITEKIPSDYWINILITNMLESALEKLSKVNSEVLPLTHEDRKKYEKLLLDLTKSNQAMINAIPGHIQYQWSEKISGHLKQIKTKDEYNYKLLLNKKRTKNGPRNSLRNIFKKDPTLVLSVFPVILTNPEAANAFIPLTPGLFDYVLFDEASQLRLEDTLTCMLRGKYKIISGDEHQMPPSSYFGKNITLDDDNDNDEDADDSESTEAQALSGSESLLDYAQQSQNQNKSYLDFHYRSQHPALINFSNAAFYGNNLIPLPAKQEYTPIHFIQTQGIYYSRKKTNDQVSKRSGLLKNESGTNPIEANAVVELLLNAISATNGVMPSVGVATFNINQRNCILKLLYQKESEGSATEKKNIQALRQAGLFIKNLENIQGDERDIIIISTTFGKDEEGNFFYRFGEINKSQKGHKFLNVIFTRAKQKIFICTSIPKDVYSSYHDEIATKGNTGKGILFSYLSYAEAIHNNDIAGANSILEILQSRSHSRSRQPALNQSESPFEEEVYQLIKKNIPELAIQQQVKIGGFRVDMLLTTPSKEKIVLECDGKTYHSTPEAHWHDVHRQHIIEKLGYRVYRIWSEDWFRDHTIELKTLYSFIIHDQLP